MIYDKHVTFLPVGGRLCAVIHSAIALYMK